MPYKDLREFIARLEKEGLKPVKPANRRDLIRRATLDLTGIPPTPEEIAAFEKDGFRPWLDKKRLMPGQNWPRAIETAIQTSDFFVVCFSRQATSKRGSFHSELRYALECASRVPLDEIYFIPVRIEECVVPPRITWQTHYVDLFPIWETGFEKVLKTMQMQEENRKRKRLLPAA